MSKAAESFANIDALPNSWTWARLGDVCRTTSGGTPSRKNAEYFTGDIPWVKSGELPDGLVSEVEERITAAAVANSSAKLFPAGTLLIALYGATVGKLGILKEAATTNQAVCAIFPPEYLDTKYLFWYLRCVRSDLVAQAVGGAQPNISQGILRELRVPIAPLDQQKRIVAEIEKQFSRLDEAVANLKRVKANLKRYKAAVLKSAVAGRLVETEAELARREGRSYETGEQLLQRILETRRSQWQGKGKYKEPAAPDTTDLPALPEGWAWASVDQLVAHLTDGDHQAPPQTDQGIPFLVIGNVRGGEIDFSDTRFVGEAYYNSLDPNRQPKLGDLLYTLVGSYGIPVRVTTEKPFCIQRHMAILRPHEHSPISYLTLAMASDNVFRQATTVATGTAQLTVPLAGLRQIAIPLPSISEQERIVAEVDRRLSLLRETGTQVRANLQRAERMRQALLGQAFAGRVQ